MRIKAMIVPALVGVVAGVLLEGPIKGIVDTVKSKLFGGSPPSSGHERGPTGEDGEEGGGEG
jgi:hypothetical protein